LISAEQVGLIDNLKAVVKTVREKSIQVFIVRHHRWEPGDFERRKHANHSQIASAKRQTFAKGVCGGEWHLDFVPQPGDCHHQGALGPLRVMAQLPGRRKRR